MADGRAGRPLSLDGETGARPARARALSHAPPGFACDARAIDRLALLPVERLGRAVQAGGAVYSPAADDGLPATQRAQRP